MGEMWVHLPSPSRPTTSIALVCHSLAACSGQQADQEPCSAACRHLASASVSIGQVKENRVIQGFPMALSPSIGNRFLQQCKGTITNGSLNPQCGLELFISQQSQEGKEQGDLKFYICLKNGTCLEHAVCIIWRYCESRGFSSRWEQTT